MTIRRFVGQSVLCVAFVSAPLFAAMSAASAEQYVVAEARGIAMAVGSVIDSSRTLDLKQGQHLVLISSSGQTIKLDGPYRRAPAAEKGVQLAAAFSGLVTERNARTSEIGTTRGAAPRPPLPSPWLIDATGPGNACLPQNAVPVLWRPAATQGVDVVITPADRSWKAETKWPAGDTELKLKDGLGVHGDASYFIALNGSESAIAIASVPDTLSTDKMKAAWLIQKGCGRQAEALLQTIK
jgi:hypothetical protein